MIFFTCNDADVLKRLPLLDTDICTINQLQLASTSVACVILLALATLSFIKYRRRCYSTLLTFHNLRSAIAMCLLVINTLELARACLPLSQQLFTSDKGSNDNVRGSASSDNNVSDSAKSNNTATSGTYSSVPLRNYPTLILLPGPETTWNAGLAIFLTLALMAFHRIVEVKNTVEFLYISVAASIYISFVRFYKLVEITFEHNSVLELEAFIQSFSGLCLFCLGITDGYTIYKERFKPDISKKADEDERKIGYKHSCSTFYSKIIFWWLTPLLWRGYKEPLEQENLGHMREDDSARAFYDQFLIIYKAESAQKKNPSLWLCYLKSSWQMFTLGGLLKFFGDLTALVGPLSIHQVVSYIEQIYDHESKASTTAKQLLKEQFQESLDTGIYPLTPAYNTLEYQQQQYRQLLSPILIEQNIKIHYPSWTDLLSNGWVIAWFVLVASLAQGALSQASTHILNMTGLRIKTSLQGLIYRKTLLLSSSCLASSQATNEATNENGRPNGKSQQESKLSQSLGTNSGNDDVKATASICYVNDVGAITNLMSEDTLNIMSFFWIAHYVWAIPLKIGVVMYLLYLRLGISAIIGSFVCILTMTPLQFLIGKAMSNNSEMVAKCTDERLKRTHDVFWGIKLIKLNAWEKVFAEKIRCARNMELKFLKNDSLYWTLMTFLTHVSSVLITFVTLAVYVNIEGGDSPSISNVTSTTIGNVSPNESTLSSVGRSQNYTLTGGVPTNKLRVFPIEFTASRLFSALALFNQLTVPLLIFPITVPIIISAIVSTRRLERFFREREVQKEFEGIRHMARILSKSDASLDMYEGDETKIAVTAPSLPPPTPPPPPSLSSIPSALPPLVIPDASKLRLSWNQPLLASASSTPQPSPLPSPQATTPSPAMSTENLIKHNNNRNNGASDVKLQEIDCSSVLHDSQHERRASHDASRSTGQASVGLAECNTFPKKRKDLIRNSRIERVKSKHLKLSTIPLQFQAAENLAVFIKGAVFSWDNSNTSLQIEDLAIPKGCLTVVVGKNASGKSSLLGALLMEMQQISGEIVWNKFSTIAYVPQVPWLLNGTIRENILFGESFRPKRYDMVLESCALKPDIELMPDGDMTIIGERGINLSGGQRQRVAIARSLYSSANVVIMDDPLSSLDNEVARHVFEKSIRKMLLKANRTVVLVTQRLQLIHSADYIVVMKDCSMQAAGTYKEMEEKFPEIVNRWKSIMTTAEEKEKICPGRTARERWKLFKNITRIGFQRPHSTVESDSVSVPLPSATTYCQPKKRSSVYGSRHLIYDMPIPIDECQNDDVIVRRRYGGTATGRRAAHSLELQRSASMHKHEIHRVHSLQPDMQSRVFQQTPVMRNNSSRVSFLGSTYRRSGSSGTTADVDLKSSKTGFQQFLHRMSSRKSNKPTTTARIHRPVSATSSILGISEETQSTQESVTETSSCTWMEDEEESSVQELNAELDSAVSADEKLLALDEERKYGEIPGKIYMLYLKSAGLPVVFVFFTAALIWQCLRVYTDVWLQQWTEMSGQLSIEGYSSNVHDVTYYFRIYAIISSICILMALITTPAGQIAGCNARRLLHDRLLQSILTKSLHFFQITPLGRIMNRFSNDMAIIDKKIAATSQRLLQFTLLCLCAILINVSITPWFVLLTLPICAAYYIIQKFYRCSSRELQRIENITNSPVISHFGETIQGVVTIRAYSQEARFTETLFKKLEANTIAFTILNTSNRWLGISLDYLGAVIVFVAIVTALLAATISSSRTSSNNNTTSSMTPSSEAKVSGPSHGPTPSLVGLAINYTLLVPIYLNWVVKLLADMEMYVGSVERVAYYAEPQYKATANSLNTNIPDRDVAHVIASSKCCQDEVVYKSVPISWPQKGDITFENVSLRYEGQEENVITDLSLKIPAGQRVGICGRTGSGKSSMALSLFGVLKTVSGRILIDDVDITQIHPEEIRSRLSIIPQDVYLFNASIRENLDPRGHYSDSDLWKCLELAQLKDVIVNAMPSGLDSEIGDGGKNLSTGHRQLFCLARAILRGSACLVLDEATSSLDTTTENALMDAAHNAFQGRTILTIAHRLSTILDYDRIIVLENGKIVEDGSPKELQENPSGQFYSLLNSGRLQTGNGAKADDSLTSKCK